MQAIAIGVVSVVSALLALASVWLLITGRNLPGPLGQGVTKGDNQRLQRAPRIYFRAMGLFVGVAAADGVFLVWMISVLPARSLAQLYFAAVIIVLLALPTTGAAIWLVVLTAKYRLFRWDKP
jgi:hypothetical protein